MPDTILPVDPGRLDAGFLDELADAPQAADALALIDDCRRRIAGPSIFSIQQNVTTADDPPGEIRLRRFHSSEAAEFPVNGSKRKTHTAWTDCLFRRGRVFVGEGAEVLARHFDDYPQMQHRGLQCVVNVPLMQGRLCYATFNVFAAQPRWQAAQLLALRLLALAAVRWVPVAPGLCYHLIDTSTTSSLEA